MASSRLVLVLEAAAQLDRELMTVVAHADVLASALHAPTVTSLRRALERASSTMGGLREHVLAGASDATAEGQEATLRARMAVVATQLTELRDAEHEIADVPAEGRLGSEPSEPPPFASRFPRVCDMRNHVLNQIRRVNAAWTRERRALEEEGDPHDPRALRRAQYVALDNAEHAFSAIGRDLDVIAFLRAGASVTSERFRIACRILLFVLDRTEPRTPPVLPRLTPAPGRGRTGTS